MARSETIGPATFAALLSRYETPSAALDAAPRLATRGGGAIRIRTAEEARRELEALERLGARPIGACEPGFPPGLAALDPPPPLIAAAGRLDLLGLEMVAIVGARNASALGLRFARSLAADLGASGLLVASGLARGIDAAAHQGALPTGTLAVMAGGLDVIYPPENRTLYEAIRAEGVIISEMAPGMLPQPRHFPRRNRIVSGVARGVVVVEAAERSGSLITANYALEQGREVFAVPGSPLDPRAKGSNRLIREGATLTETAEDVLSVLRPIVGEGFGGSEKEMDEPEPPGFSEGEDERVRALVEEKLSPVPVEVDELVRQCGAPASLVLTVLLELELAGRASRHPGNRVSWA